jgi:hypothetical protein
LWTIQKWRSQLCQKKWAKQTAESGRGSGKGAFLTQFERQVDLVGELYPLEHGLGLPPGGLVLVVEVGEVPGVVIVRVANFAGFPEARDAGLHAIFYFPLVSARVRRLHQKVESCILEFRYTPLEGKSMLVIIITVRFNDTE